MKNINPLEIKILFGLEFDQAPILQDSQYSDYFQFGPKKLLMFLETQLGLGQYPEDIEPLRIEFFYNVLNAFLQSNEDAFFKASFEVDQLATAQTMLLWRDELIGMNYPFDDNQAPERLLIFNEIEKIVEREALENTYYKGIAERWNDVITCCLSNDYKPIHVLLNEPIEIMPIQYQRLFKALSTERCSEIEAQVMHQTETNLSDFQAFIQGRTKGKKMLKSDQSILIFESKRDTDLAVALSKYLNQNPNQQYQILLQERNKTLENALVAEGIARLGVSVQSVAHPLTQILKLLPNFLYYPLDPKLVLSFLSQNFKPLNNRLANYLAKALANIPGVHSEEWNRQLSEFWSKNEEYFKFKDPEAIKRQYDFLFNRKTYQYQESIPKEEIILMYKYLLSWLQENQEIQKYNSSKTLMKQTEQLIDYFTYSSIQYFYRIDIERTIKLIFQPNAVHQGDIEVGSSPVFHHFGQFYQAHETLVFADFVNRSQVVLPQKWNKHERAYFQSKQLEFETPQRQNKLKIHHRNRPILWTTHQLILALPSTVNGDEVVENDMMGDLRACFSDYKKMIINVDQLQTSDFVKKDPIEVATIEKTSPIVAFDALKSFQRKQESPTALEDLMFYPHNYAFRYAAKLSNSPINSVLQTNRMKGNLAHKCIELALAQDFEAWSNKNCYDFVEKTMYQLLETEGVPLLLYGNQPDKESFIGILKNSVWYLVSCLRNNNWKLVSTEKSARNTLFGKTVEGRIDLLLQRGNELAVVDFKWGGITRFRDKLKNSMAIQLALYAALVGEDKPIHVAYYMINQQKMLSFNRAAFSEADIPSVSHESDFVLNDMTSKIEKTLTFRFDQLSKGEIEIRTDRTAPLLEEIYQNENIDINGMFELPNQSNPYDDYKGLIVS